MAVDLDALKPDPVCAGCGAKLHKDPRGLNTCDTSECPGNLIERFPLKEN